MSFKGGIRQVVCQPFSHFSHNSIWFGFSGLRHFWQDSLISQWIVSNSKILSAQTKGSFLGFSTEIIHSNVIVSSLIIAYKSDAAELPKIGFSINNITVKFAKLSAWFGAFFGILNDLNGLEGSQGCQPGHWERQFGCEGHHGREKSVKATADIKPFKSTLTRNVNWPNFCYVKML